MKLGDKIRISVSDSWSKISIHPPHICPSSVLKVCKAPLNSVFSILLLPGQTTFQGNNVTSKGIKELSGSFQLVKLMVW